MSDPQCKQCGGTIHPYECGSDGCCGECNYHAALTSSAAMTERGSIVAWLRSTARPNLTSGLALLDVADLIERGAHIDGLREGGGATRSSLGNRPPHHLRGDDE
jgi:hypothetical protein